jgi:hypothetical protein
VTIKPKITGQREFIRKLKAAIGNVLDRDVSRYVIVTMDQRLATNENADGSPRPGSSPSGSKKPATVKAYKKKGWDTEHYLVATGKSTELKYRVSGTTLIITPRTAKGRQILSYHIPRSQWRGNIKWLELNDKERGYINRRVAIGLKKRGF